MRLSAVVVVRAAVALGLCSFPIGNALGITVHFDQDVYYVNGPGDVFPVQILIDGNDRTHADDPIPEGLYSFATSVLFNPAKATTTGLADVAAVAALDNFGFFPGALEQVAAGKASTKGNIDQLMDPVDPYDGTILATIQLTNLASAPDEYPLTLDFFNTLGPTDEFFVDGDGNVLDLAIQFGSAKVVVLIPEPQTLVLAAMGMLSWGWLIAAPMAARFRVVRV
jgi:hypothetical protein